MGRGTIFEKKLGEREQGVWHYVNERVRAKVMWQGRGGQYCKMAWETFTQITMN